MTVLLIICALLLLAAGAAGTVFPALPGLPLMFAGAWLLAYAQDYQVIGPFSLLLVFVMAAAGMAMDFVAGLLGAKYTGAGSKALWGALIGGMIGMFFGIAGLVLGPLLGAFIGELADKADVLRAGKVGIGTLVGLAAGTAAKIGAAAVIVLIVAAQYLTYWLS